MFTIINDGDVRGVDERDPSRIDSFSAVDGRYMRKDDLH